MSEPTKNWRCREANVHLDDPCPLEDDVTITSQDVQQTLTELATAHEVPGATVGILAGGEEHYASHGVTSVAHPLEVDEDTIFQFGSTGKTYTATALMVLADRGEVDLDAPVRTYVPELVLQDEDAAERVTVLQLLNHTAGWDGDFLLDTGDGDDALAVYVARMAEIEQALPLGTGISYNNASLSLAGHVIANVTGMTFEAAMKELLFEPLGLDQTFFFVKDIITRRFAVGHRRDPDTGEISIAQPFGLGRSGAPAGGISSNSRDLVTWGRFHLGDGTTADGTRLLSAASLARMQEKTVDGAGALGDAVGISWFLSDVDGARLVSHGGTMIGQHSAFVMVPEQDVVISIMSNCGPNGPELNKAFVDWALEACAGVVRRTPAASSRPAEELTPYTGTYETIASTLDVAPAEDGGLSVQVELKPETVARIFGPDHEEPAEPPIAVGFFEGDRFVVTDGEAAGMKGHFARDPEGHVTGLHFGGRLALRR